MTNEEALQWCAEQNLSVIFRTQERPAVVEIRRKVNDHQVYGRGETFLAAVEDARRIEDMSPERRSLGDVAWHAYCVAGMQGYPDFETWCCVGDAVAAKVLELQQVAVEASE